MADYTMLNLYHIDPNDDTRVSTVNDMLMYVLEVFNEQAFLRGDETYLHDIFGAIEELRDIANEYGWNAIVSLNWKLDYFSEINVLMSKQEWEEKYSEVN